MAPDRHWSPALDRGGCKRTCSRMESPPPQQSAIAATTAWPPHRYWGKARPASIDAPAWHPLPYHALDVAAVGHAYLVHHPKLLEYFAARLGLSHPQTHAWLTFWLALHDLGKFASAFQGQRNDLVRWLQQREIACSYTETGRLRSQLARILPQSVARDRQRHHGLGEMRSGIWLHGDSNEHRRRLIS